MSIKLRFKTAKNHKIFLMISPILNYSSRLQPINYYKNLTLTIIIGENFVPIFPVSNDKINFTTYRYKIHVIV